MNTETVNLAALTEAFKAIAIGLGWCGEAEEEFEYATGVTPKEWVSVEVSCECRPGCVRFTYPPEGRFLLPEGAPESVPVEPIVKALKARVASFRECCIWCDEINAEEIHQLQGLADMLPGKPRLSE